MDKLNVVNRALSATGNRTLLVANDGSDEGNAAETAVDRAIDYLMAFHNWPFTTKVSSLVRLGVADMAPFVHAMQYPPDCWHFKSVKDSTYGHEILHRVVAGKILTMVDTGIQGYYLLRPVVDATWHPAAIEVLTLLTEAELYQGLNEDTTSAEKKRGQAEDMLARASGRVDQQDTPRPMFYSRAALARRTRKV